MTEEQRQYREDLLDWCHNMYANWNLMKPRFSQIFDMESLEQWEGSCLQLTEKLQVDSLSDYSEYQTALRLYEQWEMLLSETDARQEMEVDMDFPMELDQREELYESDPILEMIEVEPETHMDLEAPAFHEMMEVESEEPHSHKDFMETSAFPEEMEFESYHEMDIEEPHRYRDELLNWCMNLYANWENMKPRFSKLFDLESLEEWENSCRQLTVKLQSDNNADQDDYQTAIDLYEHWEELLKESSAYQEA
ncbi:hypothetical protein [Neobacillus sp. PS2-9]|uniref:hypothetical protein n=1 Tax=Neobacillus sp. PS2-9 TaxID=3070676 RepID=UPI0027E0CF3D|nr:hypothetical protein [Neobacillus sp. PS2-9]WML57742.1 hypothetical protein RCG25_23030 [Neobacillus sp. PS2-9]